MRLPPDTRPSLTSNAHKTLASVLPARPRDIVSHPRAHPLRIIRNSWSSSWGEDGYMRLKRTREIHCYDDPTPDDGAQCEAIPGPAKPLRVCGDCGVLFDVSYPLVRLRQPSGTPLFRASARGLCGWRNAVAGLSAGPNGFRPLRVRRC